MKNRPAKAFTSFSHDSLNFIDHVTVVRSQIDRTVISHYNNIFRSYFFLRSEASNFALSFGVISVRILRSAVRSWAGSGEGV